jgi:hypothetical protein
MTCTTLFGALLIVSASRPLVVPPDALPGSGQEHSLAAQPPSWLTRGMVAWAALPVHRRDLYDRRYITW